MIARAYNEIEAQYAKEIELAWRDYERAMSRANMDRETAIVKAMARRKRKFQILEESV